MPSLPTAHCSAQKSETGVAEPPLVYIYHCMCVVYLGRSVIQIRGSEGIKVGPPYGTGSASTDVGDQARAQKRAQTPACSGDATLA